MQLSVCIIKFNVFHFGLLVSFHIANLRLKISGNEVTPGENREHLHPVKFPMYTWSQETPNVTSYYKQQKSMSSDPGMRLVVVQ